MGVGLRVKDKYVFVVLVLFEWVLKRNKLFNVIFVVFVGSIVYEIFILFIVFNCIDFFMLIENGNGFVKKYVFLNWI